MKRFAIDPADRLARLKQRLGLQAKRWTLRIKFGGWMTLTPPMVKLLRLSAGDVIEWTLTRRGVEWQRKPEQARRTRNWRWQPRQLGKYETGVSSCRPSSKRHHSGGSTAADLQTNDVAARNTVLYPNARDTGAVFRGSKIRFRKQPRAVSVKHFAMNFEQFFDEVMRGRVIQIKPRGGDGCILAPIGLKERIAFRRKPLQKVRVSHKPLKRW